MVLKYISLLLLGFTLATAFAPSKIASSKNIQLSASHEGFDAAENISDRRTFVSSLGTVMGASFLAMPGSAFADEGEEESFASIAARASKLSTTVADQTAATVTRTADDKSAYDFSLPIKGENVPFKDLIKQEFDEDGRARVKAILVVNMKEDDPISRTNIPEFISLAAKYGRSGEFAVVMSPSDQGYYEPDTSQLIRLKLASEYGYGINPATVVTDKVIYLGTGAHPFWRWIQKNCRTPAGLGRIEANYEKFLVDGRTGVPLRRYPRKYKPLDIKNDIEAIINGRPLPPAGANYNEQWRSAAVSAETDTYRFQKGLNYFDQ